MPEKMLERTTIPSSWKTDVCKSGPAQKGRSCFFLMPEEVQVQLDKLIVNHELGGAVGTKESVSHDDIRARAQEIHGIFAKKCKYEHQKASQEVQIAITNYQAKKGTADQVLEARQYPDRQGPDMLSVSNLQHTLKNVWNFLQTGPRPDQISHAFGPSLELFRKRVALLGEVEEFCRQPPAMFKSMFKFLKNI